MILAETKVELLYYPYPLINNLADNNDIPLASLPDIAAMKLSAVANRGSKKDFFDIFNLLGIFSLREMLTFHQKKFPNTDLFTVVKSLSYFEDAEQEPDPVSLHQKTWDTVKTHLTESVSSC